MSKQTHGNEAGSAARRARAEHGLTMQELADKAEVSVSTISRLERFGHLPNTRALARIVVLLDLSLVDIVSPDRERASA